ncbi:MAG: hypothetical protein GY694_00030 [Gammaproteobacteria bacterium]|nr:hypothetical protein [Gammaproteobacteria bacterium]
MKVIYFFMCVFFYIHAFASEAPDSNRSDEPDSTISGLIVLPAPLPPKDTGVGVVSY